MKSKWLVGAIALLAMVTCRASAAPVYFLVTEIPGRETHHDSYVLPLEEQADILHARDLIAHGAEAAERPIVIAQIAGGADGINRDLLKPARPAWSWHVTKFEEFADLAAEVLDGWPGMVEEDVNGWIANTNGRVGFWSYTVTRELGSSPPAAIPLPSPLSSGLVLLAGTTVVAAARRVARPRSA